ncbi:NUDIX domain-containing protein [Candidatus Woesearchaeota archaeon]|nr:NUDIX domain-containing protein [Candidatus Woesearchaeota archaeon]
MDPNKAHYVVATAIIVKDGKYLIARRSKREKAFPGLWTVPGGKLELNDYSKRPKDTEDCWYNVFEYLIRREVIEETGLNVKNIKYLTSLSFIRPDNIPTIVVSFFADYDSGEVTLSKDLIDYAWIDLKEAKKYSLIGGIYEELEMLDNYLKTNFLREWNKK